MERRILIAFILSFIVLSLWSAIVPRGPKKKMSNLSVVQPKPLIPLDSDNQQAAAQPVNKEITTDQIQPTEEFSVLENNKIKAEFSNRGGVLESVLIKNFNTTLPITEVLQVDRFSKEVFRLESQTPESLVYVFEKDGVIVRNKYSLVADEDLIKSEIQLQGQGAESYPIKVFKLDINRLDKNKDNAHDHSLFEYFLISPTQSFRKENAVKFSSKEAKQQIVDNIKIAGFRDRYFSFIVHPEFSSKEFIVDPADGSTLNVLLVPEAQGTYKSTVYVGPQQLDLLKKHGLGFEEAMVFSNWGWLDAFAKLIYAMMHWLHKFIPNWGVCIILISFLIYGAMYPLTMSGMASMKRMQAVQPAMNKLREQYKNNPQRLNKEIMELYKEHRVNPMGGCLPLFMQMPVFVSLYQVLWRSVDFKGADFLWIKDLSEPDRLFILPFSLPVIGNELNILPLIMMVIMFFQQKLSAKNMVITDPSQEAQQKMMTMVFPVMLGFIFYKFASGLALYFTVFYTMSTLSQWKMSKMPKVI